jgi:hypothetical protein
VHYYDHNDILRYLLVERDILDCIIEFPRYALLDVEAALLLQGWMRR